MVQVPLDEHRHPPGTVHGLERAAGARSLRLAGARPTVGLGAPGVEPARSTAEALAPQSGSRRRVMSSSGSLLRDESSANTGPASLRRAKIPDAKPREWGRDSEWRRRPYRVPILMYHRLTSRTGTHPYDLMVGRFRTQLSLLRALGYQSVTPLDLARAARDGAPLPARAV